MTPTTKAIALVILFWAWMGGLVLWKVYGQ